MWMALPEVRPIQGREGVVMRDLHARTLIVSVIAAIAAAEHTSAAARTFVLPLDFLKTSSDRVTISLNVTITGHSKVHPVKSDCEMHFGATTPAFDGDPSGLVLEPMNLCAETIPRELGSSWIEFADALGKSGIVKVDVVPRMWSEHLVSADEK